MSQTDVNYPNSSCTLHVNKQDILCTLCRFCKLKTQPTLKRTLALLHASSPFDTRFCSWTNPSLLILKQQVSGLSEKKPDRLQEIKPKAAAPNPAPKPPQRTPGSPLKPPPQTLRNQPMHLPAASPQPTLIRTTTETTPRLQ